jgi:hypothetical protein
MNKVKVASSSCRIIDVLSQRPMPLFVWYLPTPWFDLVEIWWASASLHVLPLPQIPKRFNNEFKNCKPPKFKSKGYHTNLMFHFFTSTQQLHEIKLLMQDLHSLPSFPFPLHNYFHVFLVISYLSSHTKNTLNSLGKNLMCEPKKIPTPSRSPPLSRKWTSCLGQWEWRGILFLLPHSIIWLS